MTDLAKLCLSESTLLHLYSIGACTGNCCTCQEDDQKSAWEAHLVQRGVTTLSPSYTHTHSTHTQFIGNSSTTYHCHTTITVGLRPLQCLSPSCLAPTVACSTILCTNSELHGNWCTSQLLSALLLRFPPVSCYRCSDTSLQTSELTSPFGLQRSTSRSHT